MTATEELRALLDERGADYRVSATGYSIDIGPYTTAYANRSDTTLDVSLRQVTPEQAIAATLGSCNCSSSERTETCRLEGFADVPFSVDYEIEGYDMGSSRDYATLAECSSCGAYVIVPPSYHHVLTCDGDEVYQPYRFCPNCGRRIEVDE